LDKSALPVTEGFFPFYPSRRQNSAALRALIDVSAATPSEFQPTAGREAADKLAADRPIGDQRSRKLRAISRARPC
jgi:hypothetical protein